MNKPELMKKAESLFDEMERRGGFGQLTFCFRDGRLDYIRKETTEKINGQREIPNHEYCKR